MLAVNALYKLPKGEQMLQDAPELIEKVSPTPWGCCTECQPSRAALQCGHINAAVQGCYLGSTHH